MISQISKDANLGMPFLANHDCRMEFTKPVVTNGGRELVYTDRYGRLVARRVQTAMKITIPSKTEVALSCKRTSNNCAPEGLIKSSDDKVVLTNSINRHAEKKSVLVQFMKSTSKTFGVA